MKFELFSELYSEALESPSLELYIAERGWYYVSVTRHGLIVRQYFYNLDEAISFRDKLLEDIDKNDGKITQYQPTKTRK